MIGESKVPNYKEIASPDSYKKIIRRVHNINCFYYFLLHSNNETAKKSILNSQELLYSFGTKIRIFYTGSYGLVIQNQLLKNILQKEEIDNSSIFSKFIKARQGELSCQRLGIEVLKGGEATFT